MSRGRPTTFFVTALTGLLVYSVLFPNSVKPDTTHLIITQVQIASTAHANDEFVEIYNPTETDRNLTTLRLTRTNSTGSTVQNLIASMSGILASHHYLLIAHPEYTTIPVIPDKLYSASSSGITTNSTIILYDIDHTTIIDKVGFGTATNFETSPAPNPPLDQSLVRNTLIDTNNNLNDFSISSSPTLHNSAFISAVPTATPTPEPTIEPTLIPTSTPQPTLEPTSTPMPTLAPTPTINPTPTPFSSPEPTVKAATPTPKPNIPHQDNHHPWQKFIEHCRHFFQNFHWYHHHR